MTPSHSEAPVREWWTRPTLVLPVVGAIVLLVALLKPVAESGRTGDDRLSAHLAGPLGARALAAVATRLGWRVAMRDSVAVPADAPGRTVHAVLAPPVKLLPAEAHAYLEAVRAGDGLLLVLGDRSPLADSLGVWHSPQGSTLVPVTRDTVGCGRRRHLIPPIWPDGRTHLYALTWVQAAPPGRVVFAAGTPLSSNARAMRPELAAGFAYGQGRVVVVADPDMLRNDVLRHCAWGASVAAVRMLEWLRAGGDQPRHTLAFDEFHQGFAPRPSVYRVTWRFLTGEPAGRMLLQGVIAALVLLLALAPRALVPRHAARAERRDPLEQIDALAHAYEQVGATRTAVSRLLAGLRSRRERGGGWRRLDDDAFLHEVARRAPERGRDVAQVRHALSVPLTSADLTATGAALHRIEHSLTSTAQ